jgi:hypothetical protein
MFGTDFKEYSLGRFILLVVVIFFHSLNCLLFIARHCFFWLMCVSV